MGETKGFGRNGKRFLYLVLALNILLLTANVFLLSKNATVESSADSKKYPLLSKRIFAENQNDILINFLPLRQVLEEYVGQNKDIAVYFEYLPSGTSIGVNNDIEVKIASLVKVPTAMAIYKLVEQQKLSLDQKATIQESDINKDFGDLWKRGPGTTLSIQEAIDLMLIKSDNTAYEVLWRLLDKRTIEDVLGSLDIPMDQEGQYLLISPRGYTSILRSLYLSSYLERENSNKVLEILTRTDFNDKIRAGVPDNVSVSHKIGTFNPGGRVAGEQIYSDCGVIYQPNRPYSLCVMVQNSSEEIATQHIKNISALTYGYVSEVR